MGDSCQVGLRSDAVSEAKGAIEGKWANIRITIGFIVNVEKGINHLPQSNADGAMRLVPARQFNHGHFVLALKSLRDFRGNFTHWPQCDAIWRRLAKPLDVLTGLADTGGTCVVCGDMDRWKAFLRVISRLRERGIQATDWDSFPRARSNIASHGTYGSQGPKCAPL